MSKPSSKTCTAFAGLRQIASGPLAEVALALKRAPLETENVVVFDDATGAVIDLDLRGADADVVARLAMRGLVAAEGDGSHQEQARSGPGRPKLGVVAREVTLLPRHWAWLAEQRGGASSALRRLVEDAMRAHAGQDGPRKAREACYRFCTAMAGDERGYEEAMRALFRGDPTGFAHHVAHWPADLSAYAIKLAAFDATPAV